MENIILKNAFPSPPKMKGKHHQINDITTRYQWEHNGGYCGETSMISAGLYYGQYLSQYDMRSIASSGQPQNKKNGDDYTSQLLLGNNDVKTANNLKLQHDSCYVEDTTKFFRWIKEHVVKGNPVIIGVFNNEDIMYPEDHPNPRAGDPEYDHIVPVMGFSSNTDLSEHNDLLKNHILFSDNGLYGDSNPAIPKDTVQYYFMYELAKFQKSREKANAAKGAVYSILELPKFQAESKPMKKNYGIAILGVKDDLQETFPVRISTNLNYEAPAIGSDSDVRPAPILLTLRITVSELETNTNYNLYCYTDETQIPTRNFKKHALKNNMHPVKAINISHGSTWKGTMNILSNQKVFFRAVKA